MNAGVYYSASRKQWVDVTKMTNYHLVNALAKGNWTEGERDALRLEILRRIGQPTGETTRPTTVKPGIELGRLEPGEVILTEQAVMVAVVNTTKGPRAIVTTA